VDIADVNVAGGFSGPYYGLAFEPLNRGNGAILLENDFLYAASYSAGTGQVTGTPVRATYPADGIVFRDYSVDWDMGLKVTATHEFYHAVQYSYTPALTNIHSWYELSATGMEERLAPEVNDYFQYLRSNIPNQNTMTGSLLASQTNANYGNAIFHMFLTHKLGVGIDRPVWEALAINNDLAHGLAQGTGSQARWDSLYSAYAAAMVLSGNPAAAGSPLAFSPDMPLWPKPRFDSIPIGNSILLNAPPLTFRVIRPPKLGKGTVSFIGHSGAWRVDSSGAGMLVTFLPGDSTVLVKNAAGTSANVALANSSFTVSRQIRLTQTGLIIASHNPVRRNHAQLVFNSPEGGSEDSLKIVSESGRRVATLPADASGTFWSWSLKDPQDRIVPPGLYFFGTTAQNAMSLVVLP
jgi:hypothetical protein